MGWTTPSSWGNPRQKVGVLTLVDCCVLFIIQSKKASLQIVIYNCIYILQVNIYVPVTIYLHIYRVQTASWRVWRPGSPSWAGCRSTTSMTPCLTPSPGSPSASPSYRKVTSWLYMTCHVMTWHNLTLQSQSHMSDHVKGLNRFQEEWKTDTAQYKIWKLEISDPDIYAALSGVGR